MEGSHGGKGSMVALNRMRSQGFIHPGLDIAAEELEFALAMHAFQKQHRRRYPAYSEILYVLKSLGYAKGIAPDEPPARIPQPYGPAEIESCS